MKRGLCIALVSLVVLARGDAPKIQDFAEEFQLSNGMKFVVIKKPGMSTVAAGWVAHVGSANERPGITGMSHLFEHMMFKGSDRIGVQDAALDRDYRLKLDEIREKMFEEERVIRAQVRNGQAQSMTDESVYSERLKQLKAEFQGLIEKQRANLVKDEFDKIYTGEGAIGMNAFTSEDMTVYFIALPKNKMELWFWMESERLTNPVFREFYSERDVVFEERRMRTDSTPTGKQDEMFDAMFWGSSTYSWPVVGWPSDISAITREQAEAYFDLYYAPNNLTATIVGDVETSQVKKWAETYFGGLKRGQNPPDVITLSMPQQGTRTFEAEVDAPPEVEIRFPATTVNGQDGPAFSILADILSGRTGRLYKRLVSQDDMATRVGARFDGRKYDGFFSVFAEGKSDTEPTTMLNVLLEELEKIKSDGVTEQELQRVKNQSAGDRYRRLDNFFFMMIEVLIVDGYTHDWRDIDRMQERTMAITAEEIQRVAQKTFVDENQNRKIYRRSAESGPEDPDLASLNENQKQMVKQSMAQINQAPADKLPAILAQVEAGLGQAPADMKPALEVILKKVKAKMEEGQ